MGFYTMNSKIHTEIRENVCGLFLVHKEKKKKLKHSKSKQSRKTNKYKSSKKGYFQ